MEWELWGFFGAQGLDTRICWENLRKIVSEGRSVLTLRNPRLRIETWGYPHPFRDLFQTWATRQAKTLALAGSSAFARLLLHRLLHTDRLWCVKQHNHGLLKSFECFRPS